MTEPAMATDLRSVAPLLPLQLDSESGTLVWPVGVSLALSVLARGPSASGVLSGEALLDNIVELRHRSGMVDSGLSSKAMHGLMIFFGELVSEDFAHSFFHSTVPSIAKLALKLSSLLKEHVEHARRMRNHSLSQPNKDLHLRILPAQQEGLVLISQELASSVLACAFFCLYPSAERQRMDLPGINFDQLFMSIYEKGGSQAHKLMCILHYFERVCQSMPQGMISYERKVLRLDEMEGSAHCPDAAFWSSSSLPLCQLVVLEDGTIEGNETTALEVDFANKYLGGGALHSGCVQEEIRFMINPELIAGMLFLPGMADNEAIEIVGTERFSQYEGYGSSFRFAGDYSDKKPRDSWGRLATHIVAIDALPRPGKDQFELSLMLRELNKAFCGFLDQHSKLQTTLGVATGNWGCGVFGGDHELKSVLQWLAASEAGRPFLLYYSFNDQRTKKLQKVANWILQEGWCVWDLWSVLMEYGKQRKQLKVGFFDWLLPGG